MPVPVPTRITRRPRRGSALSEETEPCCLAECRIMELVEEVEKPWRIKLKATVGTQEAEVPVTATSSIDWRHATVAWLCKAELFAPPMLPKMRGVKAE